MDRGPSIMMVLFYNENNIKMVMDNMESNNGQDFLVMEERKIRCMERESTIFGCTKLKNETATLMMMDIKVPKN